MPHMHVWWLRFAGPELTKQQKAGALRGTLWSVDAFASSRVRRFRSMLGSLFF